MKFTGVGIVTRGSHRGMYVSVDQDESKGGWHIGLTVESPASGPSKGFDIWADDEAQVNEWLDDLGVEGLD